MLLNELIRWITAWIATNWIMTLFIYLVIVIYAIRIEMKTSHGDDFLEGFASFIGVDDHEEGKYDLNGKIIARFVVKQTAYGSIIVIKLADAFDKFTRKWKCENSKNGDTQ